MTEEQAQQALATFWNKQPWYMKALLILAVPVVLFLAIFEPTRNFLASFLENRARATTDQKSAAIEGKEAQSDAQAAADQAKLDALQKQQSQAGRDASKSTVDDDTNFFNNNPKP